MVTKDLEPGTKVVVLFPEGLGIDEPATAMATILELTDPPTGASHHTFMHHAPELQTFNLIRHCLNGREVVESVPAVHIRRPEFQIGQMVFLDHNLDFTWDHSSRFHEDESGFGLDGPFRIVGIAYPNGSLQDVTAEAEYWIDTGNGDGGPRRWWRERWLRGSRGEGDAPAEQG
jgi:hypothetical protein